ncbi:MAG: hypothetical protein AAGA67_02595, partial [Cyanobacteria bacterium P01_F01_bin.153]
SSSSIDSVTGISSGVVTTATPVRDGIEKNYLRLPIDCHGLTFLPLMRSIFHRGVSFTIAF